jgi:predicted GNAT family N-acyltransferase
LAIATRPAVLTDSHEVSEFDCSNDVLNEWLIKRALKNQSKGASRTFVICRDDRVVGYYAFASGSVERNVSPKSIARNMPEPIPVMVLGRLAIDARMQGQRPGAGLLKDALLRTLSVSKEVGIRALLVHAISEEARNFYLGYGFLVSPVDRMTLMLPVRHIQALL